MATVVAVEVPDGVVVAGDRRATDGGTVASDALERVFGVGSAGAGVAGDPAAVQAFRRHFERELRSEELQRGSDLDAESVAGIAARESERAGVSAAVAARDRAGVARLREVGADGRVLPEQTVALGSGAALALGRLEATPFDGDVEETTALLREILAAVAERDAATGDTVDVWTLATADRTDGQGR
jgi:proteasome beta subunit